MKNLSILEPDEGKIASVVSDLLIRVKISGQSAPGLSIAGGSFLAKGANPDLLVISAREKIQNPGAEECNILLIPGINHGFASEIISKFVVSYGMSARDSITFSSLEKNVFLLSIQRELPTVDGVVLERQDVPVRIPGRVSTEDAMAASAALIIAGLAPEVLGII